MRNEICVGGDGVPAAGFSHSAYVRGTGEKKRFFDQKIAMGWRTRKTDKEMETACIAAIDTQTA